MVRWSLYRRSQGAACQGSPGDWGCDTAPRDCRTLPAIANQRDLEFTYSPIHRIFRLSMGEFADFSGAKSMATSR